MGANPAVTNLITERRHLLDLLINRDSGRGSTYRATRKEPELAPVLDEELPH
jgi:hypothetical protein